MKMLHCPVCRHSKPTKRRQETCSKRCAAKLVKQRRGANFYRLLGKKAGAVSGQRTRKKAIALWLQRFPELPVAAVRAIYGQGYQAGWLVGKKRGLEQGYENALRDSDAGYAKACDLASRGRMRAADRLERAS